MGTKRSRGVAFGSGAADEDDTYGMMEDYVSAEADPRKGMLFEIAGDSDEDDLPYVMGRCAFCVMNCLVKSAPNYIYMLIALLQASCASADFASERQLMSKLCAILSYCSLMYIAMHNR